jgi:hypothetical protein
MTTIYKYPLTISDTQTLELPVVSRILHFGVQNQVPCLWVLIPDVTDERFQTATFEMFGTGNEMPALPMQERREYIGTALMNNGLVWHFFERIKTNSMITAERHDT